MVGLCVVLHSKNDEERKDLEYLTEILILFKVFFPNGYELKNFPAQKVYLSTHRDIKEEFGTYFLSWVMENIKHQWDKEEQDIHEKLNFEVQRRFFELVINEFLGHGLQVEFHIALIFLHH